MGLFLAETDKHYSFPFERLIQLFLHKRSVKSEKKTPIPTIINQ